MFGEDCRGRGRYGVQNVVQEAASAARALAVDSTASTVPTGKSAVKRHAEGGRKEEKIPAPALESQCPPRIRRRPSMPSVACHEYCPSENPLRDLPNEDELFIPCLFAILR
jgi:hypothetical protein